MNRWFARLSIHRKLVVTALVVTTVALVLTNVGLVVVDLWRYRVAAANQATTTARVIAENTAAAVTFQDPASARASLASVHARPTVRRACLYLDDGTLYAGSSRAPEYSCPPTRPAPIGWLIVAGSAPVTSNERQLGTVYVEDELADLPARVGVAAITGLVVLLVAGVVAYLLADRLQRWVSAPIARLAAAARSIRPGEERLVLPDVDTPEDEVGDLARAFTEMLKRVHTANADREELLAREREASRLKDEFLAAVSHELRTPLNAIAGWAQILTSTAADRETMARGLASIDRNARAQARVINDLVDVSRIITGKLNIRFDPVDLREVTETAVEGVRGSADSKGIALTMALPSTVAYVNGDRDRLQQVVSNLLSNAVKFTPEGGAVSVALQSDGNTFELAVTDSGIGIAPAFLPHVFDRFRQADGTTTREYGGLGLGLAIVKELTELHGGSVRASSRGPGQGSTFALRLPRLAGLHVADTPEERRASRARALAGIRVLAVDDNVDALDVLASTLQSSGASVRVAASGEEALKEWDRAPADILICDLAMPRIDGFAVLDRIRQRDQASGRVTPAIAVTAHASPEYHARTRESGFDAHVSKPVDTDELVRAVLAVRANVPQDRP